MVNKPPFYLGIAKVYAVASASGDEPFHLVVEFDDGEKVCSPVKCDGFKYTDHCRHQEEVPS